MNKAFFKRYSTYANGISMLIAAVAIYIPEIVPDGYQAHIQAVCAGVVAVCQFIKQEAK